MVTDILHDEGPLTGLTPVNVHRAVYTETIITRGAAEQLSVFADASGGVTKTIIYLYIDTYFVRGMFQRRRNVFFLNAAICAHQRF